MKHLIDLGRPMSDAEDKAFSCYLTSMGIRSRALDAAQHAIARMRPADVQADFVMWLSEGKLWVDSSGQVTRRPGTAPHRVRL
jgi:hypothetical protein